MFRAIKILRGAVKKCFVLGERKLTVYTHLTLFTLQNVLIFCQIVTQISYQLSGDESLFKTASNFHTSSTFATILLQVYLAFILFKLSQVSPKVQNSVLQREVTVHVQIKADLAMRQYLSVKRSQASEDDIRAAFNTYDEITAQYENLE